jgi:hypothetical protein
VSDEIRMTKKASEIAAHVLPSLERQFLQLLVTLWKTRDDAQDQVIAAVKLLRCSCPGDAHQIALEKCRQAEDTLTRATHTLRECEHAITHQFSTLADSEPCLSEILFEKIEEQCALVNSHQPA